MLVPKRAWQIVMFKTVRMVIVYKYRIVGGSRKECNAGVGASSSSSAGSAS